MYMYIQNYYHVIKFMHSDHSRGCDVMCDVTAEGDVMCDVMCDVTAEGVM